MTPVELDVADGVARLTMRRPDSGNAIDLELAIALREAVATLHGAEQVGAVLIHADGGSFCVGGDLRAFAGAPDRSAYIAELAGTMHEAILGLRTLRSPVLSAVQGACAGAGIGLALAADLVIAARGARFRAAYTAAGLAPDCGVSWALTRLLGAPRAADLILTNRTLDAATAHAWGLVSTVVDDQDLDGTAGELAARLAAGARPGLAEAVRLIRDAPTTPLARHLDAEAAAIARAVATAESAEAIDAFLTKRIPDFTTSPR